MRWTSNNKEAAFFGVNYTTPFAYGFRSHKALGIDIENAIAQDVYHLSRIGVDAFRVHVWDTEITDTAGNLLDNEHLRLYDFLLNELKKRDIKTILTPIAYWGNGYPEPDEKTPGFSAKYPKRIALVNDTAIRAQENYLRQLMKHVNPYTKLNYENDPHIIAAEINNEPHHSGPKEKVTAYVNRMVNAMRSEGWTKPIFYNISESPAYADAVSKAIIQGVSFQWYPTGLVKNHGLGGNYLPHVDLYHIPFGDTIPAYRNKARMVYEFDAADVMGSYMYPAIARSYRTAGFQWATQFAYDPLATANINTEYQTHYLNLLYTPSKAISLLIASKIFHRIPRLKTYGSFPADTIFDVFQVSYKNNLSEMNSEEEFYYSNPTQSKPLNAGMLKHIAGVGSSYHIQYEGSGAYFLDKTKEDSWKLEVFPDAIPLIDPFERTSPKKEITRLENNFNRMIVHLPGFEKGFLFSEDGIKISEIRNGSFVIKPGIYWITNNPGFKPAALQNIGITSKNDNEKSFKSQFDANPFVYHVPLTEITAGFPMKISAKIAGYDSTDRLFLDIRHPATDWRGMALKKTSANEYSVTIPSSLVVPGVVNYRIIIQKSNGEYFSFPGNIKGNPWSWENNFMNTTWETFIVKATSPIELFNAGRDRREIMIYNPDWRNNSIQYIPSESPGELLMRASINTTGENRLMGWQFYFGKNIAGRVFELPFFRKIVIKAKSVSEQPVKLRIALITSDAEAFSTDIALDNELRDIEIPVSNLKPDSMLLLPRPYPGFHPLWFRSNSREPLDISKIEKLEISFSKNEPGLLPTTVEVESVRISN